MDTSLGGKHWQLPHESMNLDTFRQSRLNTIGFAAQDSWDDPSVFPDTEKAVRRVKDAIARGEKMAIFGDYDCDGVTAASQILRCLRRHGTEPILKLPHRVDDGYGMKERHIDAFADAGVTLLITVDTGISAHDALARAKERGVDVIILDHHHWTVRPDAFAVLHPGLAPHFPEPHPSAAGVAFLFVTAMEGGAWEERDIDLSLALFGTVADLVPLGGFNRKLVQDGLIALRRLPDGPIKHFVDSIGNGKPLNSVDIAFRIAPRINAAGRMADPFLALTALMEGGEPLRQLEQLNVLRQEETARCIDHALKQLAPGGDPSLNSLPAFLAIADTSYSPGIVGLIAGKLTERFGRPSMAVHMNGNVCTASLRSPECYNIVEGLERHAELFTSFGGHAQAAGCSFPIEKLDAVTMAMEEDIRTHTESHQLIPHVKIDAILHAADISVETVVGLYALEPYGQGNPEPLFLVRNVRLNNMRRVGGEGKHLQAMVGTSKLIGFGMGDWDTHAAEPLDLVCRLGIDTWNDRVSAQLFLVDAKLSE